MHLPEDLFNTDGFSVIAITIVTTVVLLAAGGGYTYWAINQPSSTDATTGIPGDSSESLSSESAFFVETNDIRSMGSAEPDAATTTESDAASTTTEETATSNSFTADGLEMETSYGSDSMSVSVTSSLSVNNIQQQSIRRGVSGPIAEGISLEYAEFISTSSQRVILQSDTGACEPQSLTVIPGKEYGVSCAGEPYYIEFFAYDEEDDMISFSVGDSTTESSAVESPEDHAVVTSSEEGDIKVCESNECMSEALATCQPAELSGSLEDAGFTSVSMASRYEILGRSASGACRVELRYTEHPDASWVDQPMVCDYDTSLTWGNAASMALNSGLRDNESNCTGPLREIMMNPPAGN